MKFREALETTSFSHEDADKAYKIINRIAALAISGRSKRKDHAVYKWFANEKGIQQIRRNLTDAGLNDSRFITIKENPEPDFPSQQYIILLRVPSEYGRWGPKEQAANQERKDREVFDALKAKYGW